MTSTENYNKALAFLFDSFQHECDEIDRMQILGRESDELKGKVYKKIFTKAVKLVEGKWIKIAEREYLFVKLHDNGFNVDGVHLRHITNLEPFGLAEVLVESWHKFTLPWAFMRNERFTIVGDNDIDSFLDSIHLTANFGGVNWGVSGIYVRMGKGKELPKTVKETLNETLAMLDKRSIIDVWDATRAQENNS